MSKIMAKMRLRRQAQAAATAAKSAAEAQAKALAEKKALADAGAVTDSGRTTDVVNDTTATPGGANVPQPANRLAPDKNDIDLYINDVRNRRRSKGAALPQLSGVLGQVGALGV